VPALKPPPLKEGEALREIAALPEWARPAFGGMKALNRLQSAVCDAALFSGENLLICAPTGAGRFFCLGGV
jgi:pre-mRNA-splicing helicase BRR2